MCPCLMTCTQSQRRFVVTDYLAAMIIPRWRLRANASPSAETDGPADDWGSLANAAKHCTACALCNSRKQVVFGVGNREADLLIVGEAPGANEDNQGEPFVGRAGQLLNQMLAAIGLQRSEVYIANILKCRPPDNRDPKPEEIAACADLLTQQINLLTPKVILALGRFAAQTLADSSASMAQLRTGQHQYQNIPLVASYHPAYLLRRPTEKRKAFEDLQRLKKQLPSV